MGRYCASQNKSLEEKYFVSTTGVVEEEIGRRRLILVKRSRKRNMPRTVVHFLLSSRTLVSLVALQFLALLRR